MGLEEWCRIFSGDIMVSISVLKSDIINNTIKLNKWINTNEMNNAQI